MTIEKREEYRTESVLYILKDLNLQLSKDEKNIVENFIFGLDFVDQISDTKLIPDAYEAVLAYISGKVSNLNEIIPTNVQHTFSILREHILKKKFADRLIFLSNLLFQTRFERTKAKNTEDYIRLSLDEAVLYSKISFLFLPTDRMNRHAKELITVGNKVVRIADNLFDLREDYEKGQISFKPNFGIRLGLRLILAHCILKAAYLYPKKSVAFRIAAKYFYRCITGRR